MAYLHEPSPEELASFTPPVIEIIGRVKSAQEKGKPDLRDIFRAVPRPGGGMFSKALVLRVYRHICDQGQMEYEPEVARALQVKPVRTISGVAPVTVLTKPHPCPGKCVFCPDEPGLPKSYLADEPGAMRAIQSEFDPFVQVSARIQTLTKNGHNTDKVELLVLGGSWSAYPRDYQEEFLRRCLEAMNGAPAPTLVAAQQLNESAVHRNVGMVLETRPDCVTPEEVRWMRYLGATKIQMGAQSLDDRVRELSNCGSSVARVGEAVSLLRAAGFKLVLHWMPNLVGATPASDLKDFARLWDDIRFRPDEIKIYPCSLIHSAPLTALWERGEWAPYSDDELAGLVADCKLLVPPYCRINRVFRDIPAGNIVTGCTKANLRQIVNEMHRMAGRKCRCIRCREVRQRDLSGAELTLNDLNYATAVGEERFLSFDTAEGILAGYLRLLLPTPGPVAPAVYPGIPEIGEAAMIREVHLYGRALPVGCKAEPAAQHRGLGTQLLTRATEIAKSRGYRRIAVIAAVGTREYYSDRGFARQGTYMVKEID